MEERRNINRVDYKVKSVIVVCDTYEKYFVDVDNVSPLGMGITAPENTPDLVDKDIIIVADTLIMYASVTRQKKCDNGSFVIGIHAKRFTPEVLEYLFEHIGSEAEPE